jgi:hypothetical protein
MPVSLTARWRPPDKNTVRSARIALLVLVPLALAAPAAARPLPQAPDCPIFPATSVWNKPVYRLPVRKDSRTIVNSIGASLRLHADFGSGLWEGGPIGIPIAVVDWTTPLSSVDFEYADESDAGPYPIPDDVPIEGGPATDGERHAVIVDSEACALYELFSLYPSWSAGSGAIWDLNSNSLRPRGWTSADATGLPILPGLARHDEVAAGSIDHALRFTVRRSRRAYTYPARHFASPYTSRSLPPMGLRLRLRKDYRSQASRPRRASCSGR